MFVVIVFYLTGGFYISGLLFLATSTPPWLLRPVKASTSSELYPGCFSLLYFSQAFPSQLYRERYSLEWAFFTRRSFLPYAPSPTFLAHFVTQMMAGTSLPEYSSVPALTELSVPADAWFWTTHTVVTRPFISQLHQWATKYSVKIKLLNIFCLFKVICKGC